MHFIVYFQNCEISRTSCLHTWMTVEISFKVFQVCERFNFVFAACAKSLTKLKSGDLF